LDDTLDRLLQLRPVSYHFRDVANNAPLNLGLIAQEVEPLFPEVVGESPDGTKDIVYSELVPVTIRSVQELSHQLGEEMKQKDLEIQSLRRSNEALAQQLKSLQLAVKELQERK
ncbi:MAG: tail fiber domain-containing protein, partial [Limisphaerales bacterium]